MVIIISKSLGFMIFFFYFERTLRITGSRFLSNEIIIIIIIIGKLAAFSFFNWFKGKTGLFVRKFWNTGLQIIRCLIFIFFFIFFIFFPLLLILLLLLLCIILMHIYIVNFIFVGIEIQDCILDFQPQSGRI